MRAWDLFSGCGGFSCGIRAAGFRVELAVDNDEQALGLYAANHPGTPTLHADLSVADLDEQLGRESPPLDCIFGSPPCQDFSNSGKHIEAERAQLAVTFARLVVRHRPRAAVLENVPFFLRTDAFAEVVRLWTSRGYDVLAVLANAAACGVAQDRRRAFVMALPAGAADLEAMRASFSSLDSVPADAPTMASCLDDPSQPYVWYTSRNRWQPCVYSSAQPSPTFRCNCLSSRPRAYARRHDDAAEGRDAHVLTVAEAARIASFPSEYFDAGGRALVSRLLGNSVPPKLGAAVAAAVATVLRQDGNKRAEENEKKCVFVGAPRPYVGKPGRIDRLLGMHEFADVDARRLLYVVGTSEAGDVAICTVLKWRPQPGWTLEFRRRATTRANCDDVYIYVPGHATEFRSRAQVVRVLGEGAAPPMIVNKT